jgi:hypothetical protein
MSGLDTARQIVIGAGGARFRLYLDRPQPQPLRIDKAGAEIPIAPLRSG